MRSILGSEPRFETAIEPLARKLTEISQAEGILARTIAQAFESTQWRFSPLPLRDIQDEETTLAIPENVLCNWPFEIAGSSPSTQRQSESWTHRESRSPPAA